MHRLYLAGFGFVAICAWMIARGPVTPVASLIHPATHNTGVSASDAGAWFTRMRVFCNPVEVETRLRFDPAPDGLEGAGYEAACYGLAGKIDRAREIILEQPADDRWRAAGVVFGVAHPVADMGDDIAAGPVMKLVVEFWPNHYMALYHAGASEYQHGRHGEARKYLTSFLEHYDQSDGWTRSAQEILKLVGAP